MVAAVLVRPMAMSRAVRGPGRDMELRRFRHGTSIQLIRGNSGRRPLHLLREFWRDPSGPSVDVIRGTPWPDYRPLGQAPG